MSRRILALVPAVALAVLVAVPAEASAPQPGRLDRSYGNIGTASLPLTFEPCRGESPRAIPVVLHLVPDPTGAFAYGVSKEPDDPSRCEELGSTYLSRLTTDGRAAPSFHSGFATGEAGSSLLDVASFGRGHVETLTDETGYQLVVRRRDARDRPVYSFGTEGEVSIPTDADLADLPSEDSDLVFGWCGQAVELSDGRLRVVAGIRYWNGDEYVQTRVLGLLANGRRDPAVGHLGWRRLTGPVTPGDVLSPVALQVDARDRLYILLEPRNSRRSHEAAVVIRTNKNGRIDTTYGNNGLGHIRFPMGTAPSWTSVSEDAFQVTPTGQVFVGFTTHRVKRLDGNVAVVTHLRSDGRIAGTFGTDGFAVFKGSGGGGRMGALVRDGNGHLVLGVTYQAKSGILQLLVRIAARTGIQDRTFGNKGAVNVHAYVESLAMAGKHRLLVASCPPEGKNPWCAAASTVRAHVN